VFSEALRVTPPGAFGTIRVAREDFSLGSHRIRKGWLLNVRPACSPLAACDVHHYRTPEIMSPCHAALTRHPAPPLLCC
jgi:cytochrome P450